MFLPTKDGSRKCVISTNIAETSVTIDGVVYVVDPGFSKTKVYNPRTHIESLLVSPISRSNCIQRAGRAGRTRPGKCFRLFSETAFQSLHQTSFPEIRRTNIASALLTLLNLGIQDVVHFDWMDPPSVECMMRALDSLLILGAVDDDCQLTDDGKKLAEFPLDPNLGKVLLSGSHNGVADPMASIVAMLSVPPVHMRYYRRL